MLRDVNITTLDGAVSNLPTGDGVHIKIGVSTATSQTPILITQSLSAKKIKERLGLSPLADKVMDSIENGSSSIYCIPVAASTDGTVGNVTKAGTGDGTLTVSGKPNNAFDVVVKITGQGDLNAGLFKYSLDGGSVYSKEITIPLGGAYELPETGLTITFAEGTSPSFKIDDTFSFKTTAPQMTNSDVLAALDKLNNFNETAEFVHIVGECQAATWVAISTKQEELARVYHKPYMFVLEAYTPNADEELDAYVERLKADEKTIENNDVQVVAARGVYIGMDGVARETNAAGIICGRYSKTAVHQSIGRTRGVAGMGISQSKLKELRPVGIEDYIDVLDDAKYLMLCKYSGLNDYFVANARMQCADDSVFKYAEDTRVKNKIIKEVRREGLQLLHEDIDMDDLQNELEKRAAFMQAPLDDMIEAKEISSATIIVPEGQDVLTTEKMSVKVRYVSRGYVRDIDVELGKEMSV